MTLLVERTHEAIQSPVVEDLLARAGQAETRSEMLALVAEALTTQLLEASKRGKIGMKAKKIARPDQAVSMLRASGLDNLLVEGWLRGRVTHGAAEKQLASMREAIRTRTRTAEEMKLGILAFDGFAQRMALADPAGDFRYPLEENKARDLLMTFARALHR